MRASPYLTVAVCLSYYLPQTVLLLIVWTGAGASCIFVDYVWLTRWRNEYESSIKRAICLSGSEIGVLTIQGRESIARVRSRILGSSFLIVRPPSKDNSSDWSFE